MSAMRGVAVALVALLGIAGSACSWAPLRADGAPVVVLQAETEGCDSIGSTTARTTARVGPFRRNFAKVRGELENLARNEAGAMGGDAIRPLSRPVEGEQRFAVLRCEAGLAQH